MSQVKKQPVIDIHSTRLIFTPTEFAEIMRESDKDKTGIYTRTVLKGLYTRYLQGDIPDRVKAAIGKRLPTISMKTFFATILMQQQQDDSEDSPSDTISRKARIELKVKSRQKILVYLHQCEVGTIAEIARHLAVTATRASVLLAEMTLSEQLLKRQVRTSRGQTLSYSLNPDYPHGDLEAQAQAQAADDEAQSVQTE